MAVRPAAGQGMQQVTRADAVFQVWLVARHAKTLPTRPHRLFDTEHCAPAEHTLALGIPMITLGALAVPAWWLTGDPVLTWNLTLVLLGLLGAAAMYWLVVSWTGVPAAGIAAGLLYAFHPIRLTDVTHPTVWDGTWTVFALLFAERWFAAGRWRDAAGLAAATVLQIGASFYTLLAAAFGTPPFLVWLLRRDRLRHVTTAQLVVVGLAVATGAALLLGPYLFVETGHDAGFRRSVFSYARWEQMAPGEWLFPGFVTLALALLALLGRRRWMLSGISGDPRWALLVGALLAGWLALGDGARPLPNLHRFFAGFLPGLDAVRVVLRTWAGTHLLLVVLAGLGGAALVHLADAWKRGAGVAASAVLVVACAWQVFGAPFAGVPRQFVWMTEEIVVDEEELAFFAEIERRGSRGPLLELPLDQTDTALWLGPERILPSLFHGRRTSACFGSYEAPGRERLQKQVRRLPEPDAVAAIVAQGFSTVVFRHGRDRPASYRLIGRLGAAARAGRPDVRLLHSTDRHTAFALGRVAAAEVAPR